MGQAKSRASASCAERPGEAQLSRKSSSREPAIGSSEAAELPTWNQKIIEHRAVASLTQNFLKHVEPAVAEEGPAIGLTEAAAGHQQLAAASVATSRKSQLGRPDRDPSLRSWRSDRMWTIPEAVTSSSSPSCSRTTSWRTVGWKEGPGWTAAWVMANDGSLARRTRRDSEGSDRPSLVRSYHQVFCSSVDPRL